VIRRLDFWLKKCRGWKEASQLKYAQVFEFFSFIPSENVCTGESESPNLREQEE